MKGKAYGHRWSWGQFGYEAANAAADESKNAPANERKKALDAMHKAFARVRAANSNKDAPGAGSSLMDRAKAAMAVAARGAADLKGKAETEVSEGWHAATDAVAYGWGKAKDAAHTAGQEAQDAFERGVNRAAEGIRGVAGDRAADTFRNTAMAAEKPVQEAAKYTAGFDEGVVEGIGGMAKGLVDLGGAIYSGANAAGNSTYKFVTDSQFRASAIAAGQQAAESADKTLRDAATYAVNHPFEAAGQAAIAQGNFAKKIVGAAADAGKEFYNGAVEANNKGNLAGYIGRAEGEAAAFVGSFFVGAGEVSTAAKAGKGLGLLRGGGLLADAAKGERAAGPLAGTAREAAAEVAGKTVGGTAKEGAVEAGAKAKAPASGTEPAPAGEAAGSGQLSRDNALFTEADPLRGVMGAASESHPAEIAQMRQALADMGVQVIDRPGTIAYSPGIRAGKPGQMIIDPKASYSAWLHEYQHALDDQKIGWGGFRNAVKTLSFVGNGSKTLIIGRLILLGG